MYCSGPCKSVSPRTFKRRGESENRVQYGRSELCTVPVGVTGAALTFPGMMSRTMSELIGNTAIVHLDDIVVCGAILQEHKRRIN